VRGLQDRFEQVILITHIEPVREGLDRVINVSYDADRGCSIVEQSSDADTKSEAVDIDSAIADKMSQGRDRLTAESIESAGAGA
jgi:hypothetical protein